MTARPPEVAGGPIRDALQHAAERGAHHVAIVSGDVEWTLGDLLADARRAAEQLRAAVAAGPVLYVPENRPESVAVIVGAMAAGLCPLLADPVWTDVELEDAARRCGARAIVRTGAAGGLVIGDRAADGGVPAGDAVVGRFTSGTSGAPRCLAFTAEAVLAAARGWGAAAGYGPGDRVLCVATLNNGLAFNASLLAVLLNGATLCFHRGPLVRSALLRTLERRRATVLVGFPFAYDQLVSSAAAGPVLSRLRLAISSAAPLSAQTKAAWLAVTGQPVCDYYGLAEVGPCTFGGGAAPGDVGRPLDGVHLRVTLEDGTAAPAGQAGRIGVRTASMATDFLDRDEPRLTASIDADGFFVTQDRGRLDAAGRLTLCGRFGRLLNVAGRKLEPAEVEGVLRGLDGVRDAVVTGEPLAERTALVAYVEADELTPEQIVGYCRGRLAAYKVPERVHVCRKLPSSSTGKASRGRLRALAHQGEPT